MACIIAPLPETRDTHLLDAARHALLAARVAISAARDGCRSYTSHERLSDLLIALELEIEGVVNIAEAVADDDEEREARSREAARGNFRYARA
jgi:hypothetical protein